jgi:hypothetical protein
MEIVTIEGIVVGDFQDGLGTHGNLSGFLFKKKTAMPILILILEGILVYDGRAPN